MVRYYNILWGGLTIYSQQNMIRMKKYLLSLATFLTVAGCVNEKDMTDGSGDEAVKDFSLTGKINVSSNLPEHTRCLLFTSDPSGEANTAEPIMVAYAPFSLDVPVAKAVNRLYACVNGSVSTYDRGDIVVSSPAETRSYASARAEEQAGDYSYYPLDAAFITAINQHYPEKAVNVYGAALQTSSDLVAYDGIKETFVNPDGTTTDVYWGNTKIWITYVTDGGANIPGTLWYYTYKVDSNGTPVTPLASLNCVKIFDGASPSKTYPNDGPGKRVYLGEFDPGTRIGFRYLGNATYGNQDYPKYSTPYYNEQAYNGRCSNGSSWSHVYNGATITGQCADYKDNEYTAGVIRVWDYNGVQYATLGMENRLPSEYYWDGDFNDMICLIEATPLSVENTIDPPVPDPTTIKFGGYWLFEDNYPEKGDYDFNDLVVKYAITEIENKPTIINLQFMARGANRANSFGVNNVIYFENLGGYENVYADQSPTAQPIKQITLPKASSYTPMLYNGATTFNLDTYWDNQNDFPCILEIPIQDDFEFLWCLERVPIDDAYPRYRDWVNSNCATDDNWYTDPPVANTVWDK